jgi:uncharacterized membrane protein
MRHIPDEPAHPVLTVLSTTCGALVGFTFGIAGFMLATAFPAMLRTAMPAMSAAVFLALWAACLALPVYGFTRVFRNGKGLGARAYASCGIAAILIAFAGELTGTITFFPWSTRMYVVPGVFDRPASTPAPNARR